MNTLFLGLTLFLSSMQAQASWFSSDRKIEQRPTGQALIDCKTRGLGFKGYIEYEGGNSYYVNSSSPDGVIVGYKVHPDGDEFGFIITAKKITESYQCKTFEGNFQLVREVDIESNPELFFCGRGSSFKILNEDDYIILGDFPYVEVPGNGFRGCGGGRDGMK